MPGAFDRTLEVDRALMVRARLLLDMPKLLSIVSAQQRAATTQTPRRPSGAGGGEERAGQAQASMTAMHALFKGEVECKIPHVRADYFLCAFRSSSATSQAYATATPRCCSAFRAENACRNPCGSCIFPAQQLEREKSLVRRFGQFPENYGGNSNGFCS